MIDKLCDADDWRAISIHVSLPCEGERETRAAPVAAAAEAEEEAAVLTASPAAHATSPTRATANGAADASSSPSAATYANLAAVGAAKAGAGGSGSRSGIGIAGGSASGSGAKSGGGARRGSLSSSSSSEIEEVEDQTSEFDLMSPDRRAGSGARANGQLVAAQTLPARTSTGTGSSATPSPAKRAGAMAPASGVGSSIRDAVARRTDELADFYDDQWITDSYMRTITTEIWASFLTYFSRKKKELLALFSSSLFACSLSVS